MIQTEHALRREIVRIANLSHVRGWVANHDGNVSVRLRDDLLLCTPTAVSKAAVDEASLIVVDGSGRVVRGTRKPFGELALHRTIYRARPDVRCVLHAHPPTATGFAVAGVSLNKLLPEAVVSLGNGIPLVAYARPGTPAAAEALAAFADHDAVLLEMHGVLTWGDDPEQAYLRMEIVEHQAKIAIAAAQAATLADKLRALPAPDVEALLAARTKAGLGPIARREAADRRDASKPKLHLDDPNRRKPAQERRDSSQPTDAEIVKLVEQEVQRALRR